MATLRQATQRITPAQRARMEPLPQQPTVGPMHTGPMMPPVTVVDQISPVLKCPLPLIQAQPDALRQYIRSGMLPQNRVIIPNS